MTHLFVPYQESFELKELGFNEPCFGYYNANNEFTFFADVRNCNTNSEFRFHPTAPTFSQAFKWFRKEHGLYHSISPKVSYPDDYITGIEWYVDIRGGNGINIGPDGVYSYEEAELACLKKLIEIVKTKQL